MRTQMLGGFQVDDAALARDLRTIDDLEFGEPYIEFNCGHPWKSCMVWTVGGEVGDGVLAHYDTAQPCLPTANGQRLPYLRQLVEQHFAVEHLLFARVVLLSNNVLIPHRDYLEFSAKPAPERAAHRLHVPLATSPDCLFMAGGVCYRMRTGEVWSLDVTELHTAAVLSDLKRVHLVLDFADVEDQRSVVKFDVDETLGIPPHSRVARPLLKQADHEAILGMSAVIDDDNYMDIFGIVIKKHFRADGGPDYVWRTMREISRLSGNPEIEQRTEQFYQHCVLARNE